MVAACGGATEATLAPSDDDTSTSAPGASTNAPEPTSDPTPEPATADPTPTVTEAPTADPSASSSPDPAAATACSGNDGNREFFASIAEVVPWPVYCAVLPSGWFVDAGQYRLAGGGWLEIAYRGPSGARLELREGTACAEQSCLPSGDDLGPASFGDLGASLVRLDGGGLAVVVEPIDGATWVAIGSGLEPDALAAIAADLARVGG